LKAANTFVGVTIVDTDSSWHLKASLWKLDREKEYRNSIIATLTDRFSNLVKELLTESVTKLNINTIETSVLGTLSSATEKNLLNRRITCLPPKQKLAE